MLIAGRRLLPSFTDKFPYSPKAAFLLFGLGCYSLPLWADAWPEFPLPDHARVLVVGDNLNINGLPTRVLQISSRKTPNEVLAFYRKVWRRAAVKGGPGFVENNAGGWGIISRPEGSFHLTVQIAEADMGSAKGFLSVSRPLQLKNHKTDFFAQPAGSEVLLDLVSDDAGKQGRVVQFRNRQSVASNYSFYKQRYQSQGWSMMSELPPQRNRALLLMNKRSGKLSLVLNRKGRESYGVLVESHD